MNLLRKFARLVQGDKYDFRDRQFIMLTGMIEVALFIVLVADIILGENIVEIIVIAIGFAAAPIYSYFLIRAGKIRFCRVIVVVAAIFVILPVTFFFGGGVRGGSILWFSMAFLYVGMILTGRWRAIMLTILTLLACVEYYISFSHPEFITPHSSKMSLYDSLVSVITVGIVIYVMVWFQNRLFENENKRAREEAEKVEEMSRAQNQFFSNMSHEIRTPINTIIGLNEMILREDISDEVAEDAANIQAAGKILLHLINDILDMSKIQSGRMELTQAAYNPGDMLSEIVAMLWIRAKDKGLDFHVNVAPEIPARLFGDEVRIKQILINVINNAIKYTKEGSVTLSVECGEKTGDEVKVIYSVKDTGIGIRKESIPYLFSAFKRVDEEKNRYIEGTGLGLSIVKELTDLMNGNISVNSVYTKGTTFVIEIPQKVVEDKGIGELDMERRHVTNTREKYRQRFEAPEARLLVVDDNESNLLVVTKLLRDTKIRIDTAPGGEEALRLTLDNKYDVILMDHLMPEMDGIECHHRIRTQTGGRCKDAKVVVLTANAGEENRQLYRKEGFDGYIEKPVSGDALERELYRLLPTELVHTVGDKEEIVEETMSWMQSQERKKTIGITTESVADLPSELIKKYDIGIIPHKVFTDEGIFRDGMEINTDGLLRYMENPDHKVRAGAPDVSEHESFFANKLITASNLVHISISSEIKNSGYQAAVEASKTFDNVTVVDSGHLSSGQGLVVLEACRLAKEGASPAEIGEAVKTYSRKIHTSFVVNELDFLARGGQVSNRAANFARALMIRPVLVMKKGELKIGKVYFGSKERAWRKYIDSVLMPYNNIDTSILFVTYVGLTNRDKEYIRAYIDEKMKFDKIYFRLAAPAVAVNCGKGTFGLLYRER